MNADAVTSIQFREPGAAPTGGYVLALASLLIVIGVIFHPVPGGGFEEQPSVLSQTPWWVMHALTAAGAPQSDPLLYFAFNRLLIGYGWLGNPLFLVGLTGLAYLETRSPAPFVSRPVAWLGFAVSILSWGRGIGSAPRPFGSLFASAGSMACAGRQAHPVKPLSSARLRGI